MTLTTGDKIALYGGGGLVVLGTLVIGFIEMIAGSSHPVTGEGQIVHEALVPLAIRSYVILAGLLVLGLTAIYNLTSGEPVERTQETQQLAD